MVQGLFALHDSSDRVEGRGLKKWLLRRTRSQPQITRIGTDKKEADWPDLHIRGNPCHSWFSINMPPLTYRVTGFVHQLPLSMSESSTKELVSKSVAAVNLHSDPVTNSLLICARTLELQAARTGPEWPDEDHAYSGTDADTPSAIRPAAFINCSDQPQPSKFDQV